MAIFGEASFLLSADNQVTPEINKIIKDAERLSLSASKTSDLIVASFKKITTATGTVIPDLREMQSVFDRIGQTTTNTIDELVKKLIGLSGIDPPKLLPEGEAEIPGFDKLEGLFQRLRESSDPFVDVFLEINRLMKESGQSVDLFGRSFQTAIDAVLGRVRELKNEENKLVAQQRTISETPIVGPAASAALEFLQDKVERVREELRLLGVDIAQQSDIELPPAEEGPVGQLFDPEQFRDTGPLLEKQKQQMESIAAVRFNGVQQSFDLLTESERKAAIEAKKFQSSALALVQTVNQLESELVTLISAERKGIISPQSPARIQQLRGELARAGLEVNKFGRVVGKAGTGGQLAGFLRNLSGAFDRFGQSVEDATGIAESDVAILLGAGLAGGFAGVLRITEKATRAIIQFATEQSFLAEQTRISFGDATNEVEGFAASTVRALGVSESEALQTANAFAQLAAELKITGDQAVTFSKALTAAAGAIEHTFPGFRSTAEAQEAVAAAVTGSEQALARFGITLTELNEISKETFGGRMFQELHELEKQFVRSIAVTQAAKEGIGEYGTGTETLTDRVSDAKKAVGDFFGAINRGMVLDNPFDQARASLEELIQTGESAPNRLQAAFQAFENTGNPITAIFALFTGGAMDQFKKSLQGLSQEQLDSLRRNAEANITDKKTREEVIKLIDEQKKKLEEHQKILEGQTSELQKQADFEKQKLELFRADRELQLRAVDAQRAVTEAVLDGIRRIEDAEVRLARTREDNARKLRDLNIKNSRAIEDAVTRVTAAELELQDNLNDAQDRIEDATDRLADAKKNAFRKTRDINEKIADLEREHARDIEDAQKKIADAHRDAARAIIEALLDIQSAQRSGNAVAENEARRALALAQGSGSAAEDELDLLRKKEDFERELGRLKRDLREAELDGIEEIRRAERDKARAERDNIVLIAKAQLQLDQAIREEVRAREDAIRALNDLEVEQNRALRDAKRALEEAEIARDRAVKGAIRAFERLAIEIGLTVDKIIDELIRLGRWSESESQIRGSVVVLDPNGQPLAHGGPAFAYRPYLVGEQGPELFVPNTNGTVIPNDLVEQWRQVLRFLQFGFGTRGGSPNITVNQVANDPIATAFAVSARLARSVNN